MDNARLFKIGVNLVKFAWIVEIVAIMIGFLISIIVSYSVYFQLNRVGNELNFGDYSTILVAGLPFVLVAIVEATKIPVATALMYAKHTGWRIILFVGMLLLALITFETMINGFERNFSNLTLSIDEKKSTELLLQETINNYEEQKRKINRLKPTNIEQNWQKKIKFANDEYNQKVQQQRKYTQKQISQIGHLNKVKIDAELADLYKQKKDIYKQWDTERELSRKRLRGLVNKNINTTSTDKKTLAKELKELKHEMKLKMQDANFLTRSSVEKKYRKLIDKKEKRLYEVSDYSAGKEAIMQQTKSEKQLQEHLQVIGKNFQTRIDNVKERIDYLNKTLKTSQETDEFLLKKYEIELKNFTNNAIIDRDTIIKSASKNRINTLKEYEFIQTKIKNFNVKINNLKKEQREVHYKINRLVNQNQIYRVATYISGKNNAIEVPKEMVGTVALIWFGSLAFICSLAGVFLAISGIYIQKIYSDEYVQKELDALNKKNA